MDRHLRYSLWTAAVVLALVPSARAAAARDFTVSPTGSATGDGSAARPLDLATAVSARSPARAGDTVYLMGGVYEGAIKGIARVPFDLAVSGAEGRPVTIRPVPGQNVLLNGAAVVTGSYAEYIGLEIGDLKWDPYQQKHRAAIAVDLQSGRGTKFINCNIFGGAMGTGAWVTAINSEISGCLIHDFGYLEAAGRGHGHAFYAQGSEGTKLFENNLCYRGAGWNVHVYGQSGKIEGFDILGNICYLAGAGKPNQTVDNYLISAYTPADRIRMIGNVGYQPTNVEFWRPNARVTSYADLVNGTAVVRDNYLMGAPNGLLIGRWRELEVTGNTVWAFNTLVALDEKAINDGDRKLVVDRNTYIDNARSMPFKFGRLEVPYDQWQEISFSRWQALGMDKNSQLLPGRNGRPTGSRVFLYPNKYEKGRANLGIFNWDSQTSVEVDLSPVLTAGQSYRIYNCLDIVQTIAAARPILQGVYAGGKLTLPMRRDPISPNFDAFLLLPGG
jgi:hypothetical protein